jgi:hypothetical protein
MLRWILAASLLLGLSPALAQAPPAVPALPDTQRVTTYTLSGSTCVCAVNFAIYGDGTDVDNWIQVFIGNTRYLSTDPIFGWSLSSPTGPIGSIPRPITDAVLTFVSGVIGTVEISGARRPRRLSQFPENRGITARDFNVALTDIVAQNRENWDKLNTFFNSYSQLPQTTGNTSIFATSTGTRVSGHCAGWDANGNIVDEGGPCTTSGVNGPGSSTVNDLAAWGNTSGTKLNDMTWTTATSLLNIFTATLQGVVPASAGGTTSFLRADGAWVSPGGSGAPGGVNTNVQYNNSAAFGGDAGFTYAGTGQVKFASTGTSADLNINLYANALPGPTNYSTLFVGSSLSSPISYGGNNDATLAVANAGTNVSSQSNGNGTLRNLNIIQGQTLNAGFANGIVYASSYYGPPLPQTITNITIAAPAVFTVSSNTFYNGEPILLTGTLPTGLAINTTYYVNGSSYGSTTFKVSTVSNGQGNCTPNACVTTTAGAASGVTATPGGVVTFTAASPGQVNLNNHGFINQVGVKFATTGALPTGITAGTTYYVAGVPGSNGQPTTAGGNNINTFSLATTQRLAGGPSGSGANVNLSGSCTGICTVIPDPNALNGEYTVWQAQQSAVVGSFGAGSFSVYSWGNESAPSFMFDLWNYQYAYPDAGQISYVIFDEFYGSDQAGTSYGELPVWTVDFWGRSAQNAATLAPGAVKMAQFLAAPGTGSANYPMIYIANQTQTSFVNSNFKAQIAFGGPGGSALGWTLTQYTPGDATTIDFLLASSSGNVLYFQNRNAMQVGSSTSIGWTNGDALQGFAGSALDTGLSRGGAGIVQAGNGVAGDASGTFSAANWTSNGTAGVTCSGTPSSSFASTKGIVTHC